MNILEQEIFAQVHSSMWRINTGGDETNYSVLFVIKFLCNSFQRRHPLDLQFDGNTVFMGRLWNKRGGICFCTNNVNISCALQINNGS